MMICAENIVFPGCPAPLSADRLAGENMWGGSGKRRGE